MLKGGVRRKPSEREVLEIADRLTVQEMLVEKLGVYEKFVRDQELRELIHRHRRVYMNHCAALASYLQRLDRQTGWDAYSREPYVKDRDPHTLAQQRLES